MTTIFRDSITFTVNLEIRIAQEESSITLK